MKRVAALLVVLLLAALPCLAGTERIELLASAAQTTSGNGASIDIPGYRELLVTVNLTAGSGTLSAFSVYLEASDDGGSTWYELVAETVLKNTATAGDPTVNSAKRNIVTETAIVSSATKWTAVYRTFGEKVRARWLITPTSTPSETFAVKAIGKR